MVAALIIILVVSIGISVIIGEFLKAYEEEKLTPLKVKSIGVYQVGNRVYMLPHYYVDEDNNLYSTNPHTWETDPKRGRLLKCSNTSFNTKGEIVNSLRTPLGKKVTIARKNITFDKLDSTTFFLAVEPRVDGRHFDVRNFTETLGR